MNSTDQSLSVPTEAVLTVTQRQRNNALDELAKAQVLIEQLMVERDELAAELAALRGSTGAG